jgi:hypothetical protein
MNLCVDFKTNLAQLPEVDDISAIELIYKDTGEPCGHFLLYIFSLDIYDFCIPVSPVSVATLRGRAIFSPFFVFGHVMPCEEISKTILQNAPFLLQFSVF